MKQIFPFIVLTIDLKIFCPRWNVILRRQAEGVSMPGDSSSPGWNSHSLLWFAQELVSRPILLKDAADLNLTHMTQFYKERRHALISLGQSMVPPVNKISAMYKRLNDFRKYYYKKVQERVRQSSRRVGPAPPMPRWMQLVQPLMPFPLPAAQQEEDMSSSDEEEVTEVLSALTDRALAEVTLEADVVCRPLPDLPHLSPKTLRDIWERLQQVVGRKLEMLLSCGDSEAGLRGSARMSRCEWRAANAMLAAGRGCVLERHLREPEPLRALVSTFHLVQLHDLERGAGGAPGWLAAAAAHRARGLAASALLLQRRWHDLKRAARARLAAAARRPHPAPPPLLLAIARRYPHVITEPLSSWAELVASRVVFEDSDPGIPQLETSAEQIPPRVTIVSPTPFHPTEEDDDLILVEQEIETIDLLAAEESADDGSETNMEMDDAEPRLQIDEGSETEPRLETGDEGKPKLVIDEPSEAELKLNTTVKVETISDYSTAVLERRKKIAQALEEELEHQLRELDRAGNLQLSKPILMYESDEETGPPSDQPSKGSSSNLSTTSTPHIKPESSTEGEGDDAEQQNAFDEKLLMSATIPLMRVDAPGWRDLVPERSRGAPRGDDPSPAGAATDPSGSTEDLLSLQSENMQEAGSRKRITLPDIAEVRRHNQRMLTAQVAPLAASASADMLAPAAAPTRRSSTDSAEEGCADEACLSAAALAQVLARGGAGGAGRGGARRCCPARQHRAVNEARARVAARAGRAPPPEAAVHAARCRPPCACCCRALLDGAPALARDTLSLRDAVRAAIRRTDKNSAPSKKSSTTKKTYSKKKKKHNPEQESDKEPATSDDALQEWIRQKNLTSRFFDLNLKTPQKSVPSTTVAPSASVQSQPAPRAPVGSFKFIPAKLIPVQSTQTPLISGNQTANESRFRLAPAPPPLPPLPEGVPKDVSVLEWIHKNNLGPRICEAARGVTNAAGNNISGLGSEARVSSKVTITVNRNLLSITPSMPPPSTKRAAPLQAGSFVKLVPMRLAPPASDAPAGGVIDLCDDSDEEMTPSPPVSTPTVIMSAVPTPTPPVSSPLCKILDKLPSGISIKKSTPSAAVVMPSTPSTKAPVLLNNHVSQSLPTNTKTTPPTPPADGKAPSPHVDCKVFKISADGRLTPAGGSLRNALPLDTKKISKIVIVGKGGVANNKAPLRLTSAPGPRLLNSPVVPVTPPTEAPAPAGSKRRHSSTVPPAPISLTEGRTSDGRRVLVMRRSAVKRVPGPSPPSASQGGPAESPPAAMATLQLISPNAISATKHTQPTQEASTAEGASIVPALSLGVALNGGAERLFDPAAQPLSLKESLRLASSGAAVVCAPRGQPYLCSSRYLVAYPDAEARGPWWGGPGPRRLRLPRGPGPRRLAVAESALQVGLLARRGLPLLAVRLATGAARPLRLAKAPRPGDVALRCRFFVAAMQITKDVNDAMTKQRELMKPKPPRPPPVDEYGFVKIAPRPLSSPNFSTSSTLPSVEMTLVPSLLRGTSLLVNSVTSVAPETTSDPDSLAKIDLATDCDPEINHDTAPAIESDLHRAPASESVLEPDPDPESYFDPAPTPKSDPDPAPAPRPSRRAACAARRKLNDIMTKEGEEEREQDYLEAVGGDMDEDEDYVGGDAIQDDDGEL